MSKTRDTGFLPNVITVDQRGNVSIVSGSTTLLSVSSSGAVTTTGVISGSNAANALLLNGTGSVGFATTGSFSTASGSVSSRITQIEQVYATTGSNSFRATQSITGSLTVTGQIIAQTINVQQVTSSIVFSSGSNTFGGDLNNRQTFTGSFFQTGSVASFSNCIGIGTNAPNASLHINGTPGQSNPSIRLTDSAASGNGGNVFISADKQGVGYNNLTTIAFSHTFKGGGSATNYLTIDSNGVSCFASRVCAPTFLASTNIGINDTNPSAKLQINCANTWGDQVNESINIINSGANGNIFTQHNMGAITWYSSTVKTAAITAWRNVPASGDFVDLAFATSTAGTQVERMRIMSGGSVGIGTVCPQAAMHICTVNTTANLRLESACDQAGLRLIAGVPGTARATRIDFLNGATCVGRPQWSIINDFNQNGTNDLRFINCDPSTSLFSIAQNGVACFSNIACAAGFSTSGFLRAHNTMRTFALSKNFGERESNANYFRISNSAASGYQVMIYSVAQNGSVGWVQSQLYQAATAPYWGGWVGTDGAVTTTGSGAGYISSVVNGNDGTITFRVTTGNNGTNTTGTILSYIQVTAFNIDNISITAL